MLGLKSTVSWSVLLRQLYSRDRGLSHSLATSTLYHSSSLDSSLRHILIDGLDRGASFSSEEQRHSLACSALLQLKTQQRLGSCEDRRFVLQRSLELRVEGHVSALPRLRAGVL